MSDKILQQIVVHTIHKVIHMGRMVKYQHFHSFHRVIHRMKIEFLYREKTVISLHNDKIMGIDEMDGSNCRF